MKGTHGHIGTVLHDGINRVSVAHPGLEANDGLVDVRHQDAVGQEARRVGRHRGDLAHALAESDGGLEGLLAGLQAADDLDALLHRHGVHEVRGDDAGRGRGVGGIRGGGRGDLGDGDGGRVGGEDGVRGADLGELAEDVELELGDLGDGLDDEVDRREIFQLCASCQEGAGLVGLLLCDSRLGDILGEEFI